MRFESRLSTGALMGKYWAVFGWAFLILIIGGIVVGAVSLAVALGLSGGDLSAIAFDEFINDKVYVVYAYSIFSYLLLALAIGIFIRIYLVRGVWERLVTSTTAYGLEAADNVVAKGGLANALGEGFANDLDIGGF